ncbi:MULTISPECIES: MFS transporter [unclassified Actinotalea]|uniref:MFS transporter n=1 Tax=unclassified Actinotalea TaxID=2638618 RepID=UPI0015F74C91|nr:MULTISPECIES: MFS transporter [unclassified Actinotalea]
MNRKLVLGVFVPVTVFETGIGAIVPVVALTATRLGASLAGAGLVVALLAVGQILGNVPATAVAARLGDRRAMLVAACGSVVVLVGAALAPNVALLAVALTLQGALNATFMLARHSYLAAHAPVERRARVLSTLAGLQRAGTFVGPFLGAALMHVWGLPAAWWLAVGTSLVAAAVVAAVPDEVAHVAEPTTSSLWRVARDHRHVLATLGIAVLMIGAARGARQVVLPLWSEHLGLAPATTSLVFGLSGAVDMLLFYPAGRLMDRRGRLWAGVPSMLVLASGLALLPLASGVATLAWVAMLIGLGNGMGAGILMTLGADVAPPATRAQFLGVWRLVSDVGAAGGPLVVSGGAALGSLAGGIWTMAGVAALSAAALLRWAPRWTVHANRTTRRRAREAGAEPAS